MPEARATGVYVYGVLPASSASLPALVGMDGAAVGYVRDDHLAAVVTEVSMPRPAGRRKDLLSHSDVLNAVAREHDVVPMRFGTVLPDRRAVVREVLEGQEPRLTAMLDRVAGAVQLNLRATYHEDEVLARVVRESPRIQVLRERTKDLPAGLPHPETLELGRLVAARVADLRMDDSELVTGAVRPFALDLRSRDRSSTDHVLDLALLVERGSVSGLEAALERLAREVRERMRLSLSEPLAAFDFVEEEAWV